MGGKCRDRSEIVKGLSSRTLSLTLRTKSSFTKDGRPLRASSCTSSRPSLNIRTHFLTMPSLIALSPYTWQIWWWISGTLCPISNQGSPVTLLEFQMAPRFILLMSYGSKKSSPDTHVWLKPKPHVHIQCGPRLYLLLHTAYTMDCLTAPLFTPVFTARLSPQPPLRNSPNTQLIVLNLFCSEDYPKSVEKCKKNSFTVPNKVRGLPRQFSWNLQAVNGIRWRLSIPTSTQIDR